MKRTYHPAELPTLNGLSRLDAYRPTRYREAVVENGPASFTSSPWATITNAVSTGPGAPGKKITRSKCVAEPVKRGG